MRLTELPTHERPFERLLKHGPKALRDIELLALLLRKGDKNKDVLALSEFLFQEAGSLTALMAWSPTDYAKHPGMGKVKTAQLMAAFELARRVQESGLGENPLMREPADIARFLSPRCRTLEVEKFWTLCLNTRRRLIRCVEVTSGTATSSLAHPREVFREAIRLSASCIAIAHNHPSGDPEPSAADIGITRQLREAARVTGIELVDHIIVGRSEADPQGRGYFSFRSAGIL